MKIKITNINIKRIIFVSLLFAYFFFSMQAQVTIGSKFDPLKGALLDLKENEETFGDFNSEKGIVLSRVSLTNVYELYPMLTGTETDYSTLKLRYTGLTVYNVSQTAPFEKGIYIWDGTKWNLMKEASPQSNITGANGLSGTNNIKMGGSLIQNTIINLDDYNLIFDHNNGKIGIGAPTPNSVMHITNPGGIDPLILRNLKFVKDQHNEIDGLINDPRPVYYDLVISENGVVRKLKPLTDPDDPSFLYNLRQNTTIARGLYATPLYDSGSKGSGGTFLEWANNTAPPYDGIKLPEDGAYVFSFNLFGRLNVSLDLTGDAKTYYISAFKNGKNEIPPSSNLVDIAEIVLNKALGHDWASYTIVMTVSGNAGDIIYFKLSSYFRAGADNFTWTLYSGVNKAPDRTTMVYWKL